MLIIGIACLLLSIVLLPAYGQQAPGAAQPVPPPPPDVTGQGAPPALPGPPGSPPDPMEMIRAQQWKIEQLRYENDLLKQKIHLLEQLLLQQSDKP
jgi:hypothetical protein